MIDSPYLATPGKKFKLDKIDTSDKGPFKDREEAEKKTAKDLRELTELQDLLYAQDKKALLVVVQFRPFRVAWEWSRERVTLVTILITTILLLVIYMTIHLFGIKASSQLNNFSVVAELIGITAVGAGLLIYSLVAHLPNATGSFLTSHGTGAAGASDSSGCNCRVHSGNPAGHIAALLLLALPLLRRRNRHPSA